MYVCGGEVCVCARARARDKSRGAGMVLLTLRENIRIFRSHWQIAARIARPHGSMR